MPTRKPRFATIIQESIEAIAGVKASDGNESMRITTTRTQYVVTVSGGKLSVREAFLVALLQNKRMAFPLCYKASGSEFLFVEQPFASRPLC